MLHLALRARSVHPPHRPYTCSGLGDRIHSCTLAWAMGQACTLHLTRDKLSGGRYNNKPESWAEIANLFPAGRVLLRHHHVADMAEHAWVSYLQAQGIPAVTYCYGDHAAPHEPRADLDISRYLRPVPRLPQRDRLDGLPDRYITAQFDAGGAARRVDAARRTLILDQYIRIQGLDVVVIGAEAKDKRLRDNVGDMASAISHAACHVGVDSMGLHLATLYLPGDAIHLCGAGTIGHHVKRAIDNGARWN